MSLHLRVADSLDLLVDGLAEVLAVPLEDPFATEVVVVPGEGVRSWLVRELARRCGPDGAGVVANIDVVYPAELVRRALGSQSSAAWTTGPLTWAVHGVLAAWEADDPALGGRPLTLQRSRAIADLFDRYTLHRPAMVTAWSAGRDVDAAGQRLGPDRRWQPEVWRAVRARWGGTSDAEAMAAAAADLRVGRIDPDVPARVALFGLASMPSPHLRVMAALSNVRDVHVFAPVPSPALWEALRSLPPDPLPLPLDRRDDPSLHVVHSPLVASWGRAAREAHLLLLDAVREVGGDAAVATSTAATAAPRDLLGVVRHHLRSDAPLPPPDERFVHTAEDRSIEWHRCHGIARQVEVLRDVVLHLLQETDAAGTPRFEPRDIVVLCPDVGAVAAFVQAAFSGDPDHGVPAVPVRVTDRSLRAENPVLAALAALLDLLDSRFTASSVLSVASLPPVRRRFGLDTDRLERLGSWVQATHVRWGLDADHRTEFGVPADIAAHTWRSGLDQLLLGAAMADRGPRLGPGDVVPYGDIEGDDVETAGLLADLVDELSRAVSSLQGPSSPDDWCARLAEVVARLMAVSDDESHQLLAVDDLLAELRSDIAAGGEPLPTVTGAEMATLLADRLAGRPGRPRLGTGAVTVSSLTAQRGVPHRVVCLLGLDGDLGSGDVAAADDLSATPSCVGDRDPRSELRAQLLDAVLSAGERLVVTSTGRDVRTNAEVSPAVALAEFMDTLDAVAVHGGDRVSNAVAVDHPRQAWNRRTVTPDLLRPGPWSFDRGVLAALTRHAPPPRLAELPPETDRPETPVTVRELMGVLRNPVQSLLVDRLGVWLDRDAEPVDDLIPLASDALERWRLSDELLTTRLAAGARWSTADRDEWIAVQRSVGAVPPLELADSELLGADSQVDALLALRDRVLDGEMFLPRVEEVDVEVTLDGAPRRVVGIVDGVCGDVAVAIVAARLKSATVLQTWLRAALLTLHRDRPSRAATIGRPASAADAKHAEAEAVVVAVRSVAAARQAVVVVVDMLDRARRSVLPALPATTDALAAGDDVAARQAWEGDIFGGERGDSWVSFVVPDLGFDELLQVPPLADEVGPSWGDDPSRVRRWAMHLWGSVRSTSTVTRQVEPQGAGS